MGKWTPKIILEGTRLTNKTETAFALNEHPRLVGPRKYRYHSPIISAEWCGLTNQPWGRGLINYLPEEEELASETYDHWLSLMERLRYYSWIIDRFHLSTQAYQLIHHANVMGFHEIEKRLKELNFRLVLLTRRPGSFKKAREERLLVSGNPAQYDDLSVFIEEQRWLKILRKKSILISTQIDVSDKSPEQVADWITDWVIATGGLEMDEPIHPLLHHEP